ncbi:MAG: hypothetical protein ACI81L_003267 [Verrucomicrobiales bacterium]
MGAVTSEGDRARLGQTVDLSYERAEVGNMSILWDVERRTSAGVVWDGSGIAGNSSWFDDSTNSLWVSTSAKVLQIPLDPERWVERACEVVGRELTQDEWDLFVPGDDQLESACV